VAFSEELNEPNNHGQFHGEAVRCQKTEPKRQGWEPWARSGDEGWLRRWPSRGLPLVTRETGSLCGNLGCGLGLFGMA
jgi:hypothetical protein